MEYIKTEEYEINKQNILSLQRDFYYATNMPIWLYSHSGSVLMAMPEKELPVSCSHEFLEAALQEEKLQEFTHKHLHGILLPIIAVQGVFGFLYTEMPETTDPNVISGIKRFLYFVESEIIQNNLIILQYQRYVDQFKQLIWNVLDQDLSVTSLCQFLNIGKTKLSSNFAKYTGTTAAKFVLNTRMEKAQVLLKESDLSITEISEKVGFNDYNYFCRVFRKYYGVSPQTYRMNYLASKGL